MKLFSEKVNSTFTNSSFNVLQVENFSEIFFDVYEIELNKIKYPAEKIDEHDGHPVVSVPVVIGEQEYKYPFVLLKGPFEVLFNEKNDSVIEIPEAPELIEESIEEVEDVGETTNFEVQPNYDDLLRENSKKEILKQIKLAKQQAAKQIKNLKESALSEATFDIKLKKKEFDKTLQDAKDTLVSEFVQISNNIKSELLDANNDRYSEIKDTVSAKIGLLAENLQSNITEDFKSASKSFDANIRALVMELHTSSVLPKLKDELTVIASDVVEKVSKIEECLNDKLSNKVDVSMLEGVNNEINAIQIANVELNNNINKGVNKALSRLGNVNNKIDDAIVDLSESVDIKIKSATDNITNYYSSKIKELEDQTFEINESSRKYFIDLIQESKNNLIQEIRNIKKDAPIEYVIESKTGRTSKSFDSLTSDLDKKISDKISDEVIRLRKYISLYSGGGTVAQQFAAGGIMNGNLTVVGSISASNYLGLVVPNPDLSQYLPLSGGTITGNLTVNNSLSANILSISGNSYYGSGATFTYETDAVTAQRNALGLGVADAPTFGALRVNGNSTLRGNLSVTGTTTFNNTTFAVTSALSVVHIGGGPAMYVGNSGLGDIASFYDIDQNLEVFHIGGANGSFPNVGVKTSTPNKDFTVVGEISATSNITTSGNVIASNYNPGANVAAFLQTPRSDNLRAALTDHTGTGANVFADNATLSNPTINNYYSSALPDSTATCVRDGPVPKFRLFEDFPNSGNSNNTIGTHGWLTQSQGGSGSLGIFTQPFANRGSTTAAAGVHFISSGAVSGNYRQYYLNLAGGAAIGQSFQSCFALAQTTACTIASFIAIGGYSMQIILDIPNGTMKFITSGAGLGPTNPYTVDIASGLTFATGNLYTGTRYRLYYKIISSTQIDVYLASAAFNSSTWTTMYSGVVTHSAVNYFIVENFCFPFFGITTLENVNKTVYVDWFAVERDILR
jgi:hypothetical protein